MRPYSPPPLLAHTCAHSGHRRAAAPSPPTCSSYWPGSPTWLARVSRRTRSSRLVAMKKRCLEAGSCSRRGSTQPLPSRTRRRRAVARPMVTGRTRTFRPKPFGRGAPSPPPEPATASRHHPGPGSARALGSMATPWPRLGHGGELAF